MEKSPKPALALSKKLKRKSNTKVTTSETKKLKAAVPENQEIKYESNMKLSVGAQKIPILKVAHKGMTREEIEKKYPVLKDKDLVNKFLKVPFNNNQKGRIRQAINLQLKGTTDNLIPDVIHGKIQAILKSSDNLTDSELRRIRILYNMLNTSVAPPKPENETPKPKKEKKPKKQEKTINGEEGVKEIKDKKEQLVTKTRGPKRYVVFIGNLPLDIDKEKLMGHFNEMNEFIKDIRIPKVTEGKKSAIAYLELSNEPSYELALSKHHSMLNNKRINVLYSTQKNSKISKAEAKSKSAKLIALQKTGKLLGSVPLAKKRSHRRMIMKKAQAKAAAE